MDNQQYLDKELEYLRKEIKNLKTAHVKTATTISTMEASGSVNFSLKLDTLTGQMYSTKRAVITLTSSNSTNFISACYLDGATPSNLNSRYVIVNRLSSASGLVKFEVMVISQNGDDYNTLSGGGSVNLSYNIKMVGSSKFSTSIDYRNIDGGSS